MSQFFFKDKDLIPENIRKGVKIGKVTGTLEGGVTQRRGTRAANVNNQDITADSSTLEQVFTYDEGYDGIGIFTLLPYLLQSKTVSSSTSSQTIAPDQGYDGLYQVIISPYTLESRTVNSSTTSQTVTPGQGYDGLSSVTVNPYTFDTKSVDPSTVSQTVNSSADGMSSVSVSAVTSSIDSNIQAGNIKDGVTILGVTGNLASGDWVADARKGTLTDLRSKSLAPHITNRLNGYAYVFDHAVDAYRHFPSFTGTRTSVYIDEYKNAFSNSKYWYHDVAEGYFVKATDFPFTYINKSGLKSFFENSEFRYESGIRTHIRFPDLASIENSALDSAFKNASGATNAVFQSLNLTGYSDYGMRSCFENFNSNGYYFTLSMPSLTNVTSHAMESICKGVSMMNLPDFLPNITNIAEYGMSESFKLSSASNIMTGQVNFDSLTSVGSYGLNETFSNRTGLTSCSFPVLVTLNNRYALNNSFYNCTGLTSASFPELTTISGQNGMANCFYNCTGLTSVSFPELVSVNSYGFDRAFYNCTGLTSVSFPELTTLSGTSPVREAFSGCTSLTTFSAPKLSSFSQGNNMFGSNNTTLTTATLHPGCLKDRTNYQSPICRCLGLTDLTLTADATDNVGLDYNPNLTAASVLSVLTHLDLNTSGKTCTFYSSGLTVSDDLQGSLQAAYDAAVNAGWTINNLTINPSYMKITSPSDGILDLGTSNTIGFDTVSSWTAVTSSNDITLDSYSGSAGLSQSVTITTPSNWEGNETVTFTCNNVDTVVHVYNYNNITFLTKITTNNDVIDIANLATNATVFSADVQRMSGGGNIVSNNGGTTTFNANITTGYYRKVTVESVSHSIWAYNDRRYQDFRGGLDTAGSTFGYVFIGYENNGSYNSNTLRVAATDTPMCAGDSRASFDFYGLKFYEKWKDHDKNPDPLAVLVHDYKPASNNNVCGFFDDIEKKWYPCRNGLVTGTV